MMTSMITSINCDTELKDNSQDINTLEQNRWQSLSEGKSAEYRSWSIHTSLIRGKLWVHWRHPKDPFIRYGCPLTEGDMEGTINHVRFLIDTAILLETRGKINQRFDEEIG